jgi:hypothetical protein
MTETNEEWLQSPPNSYAENFGQRARLAFTNFLPSSAVVSAVSAENSILDKGRFGEPPKTNTQAGVLPGINRRFLPTETQRKNISVCFVSFVVNEMIVS